MWSMEFCGWNMEFYRRNWVNTPGTYVILWWKGTKAFLLMLNPHSRNGILQAEFGFYDRNWNTMGGVQLQWNSMCGNGAHTISNSRLRKFFAFSRRNFFPTLIDYYCRTNHGFLRGSIHTQEIKFCRQNLDSMIRIGTQWVECSYNGILCVGMGQKQGLW